MVTTDFFIVKASSIQSNSAIKGIIGLAPTTSDAPSYVEELYLENHIESQVISFFFNDQGE